MQPGKAICICRKDIGVQVFSFVSKSVGLEQLVPQSGDKDLGARDADATCESD
jgi:hypothetical protein